MPLLVLGGQSNGDKWEVIDLNNDNSICENIDDDHICSSVSCNFPTGGLVDNQPMVCMGKYCSVLGQSNKIEMNEDRTFASSIVIGNKVS